MENNSPVTDYLFTAGRLQSYTRFYGKEEYQEPYAFLTLLRLNSKKCCRTFSFVETKEKSASNFSRKSLEQA